MRNVFLSLLLVSAMLCGCGGSAEKPVRPPKPDAVLEMYNHYVEGKYADYVREIHSNIGKPESFLEQMEWLMQQNAARQMAERGGVAKAEVGRIEQDSAFANVFMLISYGDSSREEILLPLVFDKGRWWIR